MAARVSAVSLRVWTPHLFECFHQRAAEPISLMQTQRHEIEEEEVNLIHSLSE